MALNFKSIVGDSEAIITCLIYNKLFIIQQKKIVYFLYYLLAENEGFEPSRP